MLGLYRRNDEYFRCLLVVKGKIGLFVYATSAIKEQCPCYPPRLSSLINFFVIRPVPGIDPRPGISTWSSFLMNSEDVPPQSKASSDETAR